MLQGFDHGSLRVRASHCIEMSPEHVAVCEDHVVFTGKLLSLFKCVYYRNVFGLLNKSMFYLCLFDMCHCVVLLSSNT